MERKIGEIFEYKGEWYQCVKEDMYDYCKGCASFENLRCTTLYGNRDCWLKATCKKLEKVGEPYVSYRKLRQRYKLFIPLTLTNGILDEDISCDEVVNIIDIAIKQNQEDMEEKTQLPKEDNPLTRLVYNYVNGKISDKELIKSIKEVSDEYPYNKNNLKPFSLEAAKAGKPVCTRDGRKARIICFDRKDNTPIVALIERVDGIEILQCFYNDGIQLQITTS